jgi:hypothetical protein
MDKPDSVRRVIPPITTINTTIAAHAASNHPTRRRWPASMSAYGEEFTGDSVTKMAVLHVEPP